MYKVPILNTVDSYSIKNCQQYFDTSRCRGAPKLMGIQYYQYKVNYNGKTYYKLALSMFTFYK